MSKKRDTRHRRRAARMRTNPPRPPAAALGYQESTPLDAATWQAIKERVKQQTIGTTQPTQAPWQPATLEASKEEWSALRARLLAERRAGLPPSAALPAMPQSLRYVPPPLPAVPDPLSPDGILERIVGFAVRYGEEECRAQQYYGEPAKVAQEALAYLADLDVEAALEAWCPNLVVQLRRLWLERRL